MERHISNPPGPSKREILAGRVVSGATVLFLLFDAVIHIVKIQPVADAFAHLGLPMSIAVGIGLLELVSVALYLVPRTAVLGAILLTGYLGGAILTLVRVGDPFFFPIVVGVLVWLGLALRDGRLRALVLARS